MAQDSATTQDQSSERSASAMSLLATCTFGLEAVVARELEGLGYRAKPIGVGRVRFEGDERGEAIARANLWLRSADRVLIRVGEFAVGGGDEGFEALFEGVKGVEWERYIPRDAAFPVSGRSVRSLITSVPAIQRATKRAIVERLKKAYGKGGSAGLLPETGPRVQIEVGLLNNVATLTIDTSGAGLHKRGYREGSSREYAGDEREAGWGGGAALKETLAAGLVLLSVWRRDREWGGRALIDPFCGTGTIPIEAAMLAKGIAPGLHREFDFEKWGVFDGEVAARLRLEAREKADVAAGRKLEPTIHASDIDEAALKLARRHAVLAGVERDIHFVKKDFAELGSRLKYGCVMTNPPYGVRSGEEIEVERLYRMMPSVFRRLETWSFHVLTGRLDLERLFGQEAARRRKLYNSTIECCYYTFLGPRPEGEAAQAEKDGDLPMVEESAADAGIEEFEERPKLEEHKQVVVQAFGGLRERDEKEAREFAACLGNNLRHLRKLPTRGVHCYRVYERDVPDVPLIVDRYGDRFHVVEYEREHSRTSAQQADWFDLMRRTIAQVAGVPIEHVYIKEKHRQVGLTQHEKVGQQGETFVVEEGEGVGREEGGASPARRDWPALKFEVNLSDYIDTGLFLDHRLTRQFVREQAKDKRFLNLFCYTGSFTVYAASGGAAHTTSVDLSKTYLAWAERNMRLNGFDVGSGSRHEFVRSDVMAFLRGHERPAEGDKYDLVVVDPPTFSNSKSTQEDWVVAQSHGELFEGLKPLITNDALVLFSTNYRRFKLDEERLSGMGLEAREMSGRTVPPEYRNRRIHRCWRVQQQRKA